MNRLDAASGLVASAVGVLIVMSAAKLPDAVGQDYGPGVFPTLIGAGLIGAGLLLAVQALVQKQEEPTTAGRGKWGWLNAAIVIAALLAYIVLSDRIGFHITAIACVTPVMWMFTGRPLFSLFVTSVGTIGVHAAFYSLFRVPLPWGLLQPFAW